MDFPNNKDYLKEFSERTRTYLILCGTNNEFEIVEILNDFFKSNSLSLDFPSDWVLWQNYLNTHKIQEVRKFPIADRSWQFGSMIPISSDWKRDRNKTKQSIVGSLKPLFIIASIFLWSLLYYIIIFRLL
ncbi:hypothetical protein [Leptospira meyeri]|uniref:Uncharacterized protein n=1 Tax=Leptospira meyeri TaxID=29508 RepID=A0A4R8MTK5_LEPME|nr:hypothetical protein [Leptospira meyeri]EKJ85946.1 hypothetical protein LEP1GSC017_0057 [Leptospira meyeri serovar Hardjo str. Went 5]EMJ87221.1 hypothetical protein LEP1GSC196_0153 [Leptospira meyeri serovar Semaranga str. Veldrot Semarang 173]TDY68640.1 hypothetical protein CLV96_3156 [Leptospira meyeri]TGL50749.1 hypothetical protein EHQ55_06850 [Leptospira meyeri]